MKTLTEQYILKSRTGVYQDTSENRRLHRVGQHYGEAKKEGEEGKSSKREQREARLASYKKNLATISEAIKNGKIDPSKKEAAEALKAKLEGKITKLEARLNKKGQQKAEEPKSEAKKKPFENRPEMPMTMKGEGKRDYSMVVNKQKDGKGMFEALPKEKQEALLKKYKEASEVILEEENMTPGLVIGEVEEFRDNYLDSGDDIDDAVEELGVSREKAEKILKHVLGLEIKRLEGLQKESEKKETGSVSWDKQDAFFKKGTDEYKLLDDWEHFSKRRDPFYQKEMQKTLEKKFPNIDEWRLTSPNTGVSRITAVSDGKEVASIDLGSDYDGKSIPALQSFMDKCHKVEKTNKKPEKRVEKKPEQKLKEKPKKVPKGHRIHYEDDLVEVYNDKGKEVYHGILDYCPYKDENYKWNEADQNYDLPQGYKMVGKTKH